jgi:hypothetical protein
MVMSASPSQARVVPKPVVSPIPVAGPPGRPPVAAIPPAEEDPIIVPWWTPESVKGWAGSVSFHAVFLLILGFWAFGSPSNAPIAFDSRLAGSPNGVPEGDTLTGGLNSPLPMPLAPIDEKEMSLVATPLTQMDTIPLEADLRFRTNKKPSAGGGEANDNPGAGDGDGFGLARFGEGGEMIRGVSVKVGDPQFTLIWNTDQVDLDLHVLEPGGKEIYWESPKGDKGGELDVDNTKGYGPENVYWLVDAEGPGSEKVKGPGPPGVYKWYVVYWGGFGGIARPTHWQVRVKHDGQVNVYHGKFKALNERSKIYTLKVDPPSAKARP